MKGHVVLVGAGPGDPDLLTLRAAHELERAEVVLYDALIDPALLLFAPSDCERIDVGKRGDGSRGVAQEDIAELLVAKARAGLRVVRLKGGDPFMFGRGAEEAAVLSAEGIPFEIVPGVTSALAVPAYAGIPVTERGVGSSLAVVTGHRAGGRGPDAIDWPALAGAVDTVVVLMGTTWLPTIAEHMAAAGRDPDLPAAVIEHGTRPEQRVVTGTLADIAERVAEAGLRAPTVIVLGEVVAHREQLAWYERRPLFGRRVLVGRAEGQSADQIVELRRRGARPLAIPLLEIAPPEDPGALVRARNTLVDADWLVFTSANGVRALLGDASTLAAPAGLRVACVGAATAAAARAAGFHVDVVPAVSAAASGGEGAAGGKALAAAITNGALRAGGGLKGARVLFPRAERARPEFAEALRAAGALVDDVIAYRTGQPADLAEHLSEAVAGGLDGVVLGSPSSVEHFFSNLPSAAAVERVRDSVLFVAIGPTTAQALAAHGPAYSTVADDPSASGICDALERLCSANESGTGS